MKSAIDKAGLCVAHGGGKPCNAPACTKSARGRTGFCKAHGGGKRCPFIGCTKSAQGKSPWCIKHGGGNRCRYETCKKSAIGNTSYCVTHGGGKRCMEIGCKRSSRGSYGLCLAHSKGKQCQQPTCIRSEAGDTSARTPCFRTTREDVDFGHLARDSRGQTIPTETPETPPQVSPHRIACTDMSVGRRNQDEVDMLVANSTRRMHPSGNPPLFWRASHSDIKLYDDKPFQENINYCWKSGSSNPEHQVLCAISKVLEQAGFWRRSMVQPVQQEVCERSSDSSKPAVYQKSGLYDAYPTSSFDESPMSSNLDQNIIQESQPPHPVHENTTLTLNLGIANNTPLFSSCPWCVKTRLGGAFKCFAHDSHRRELVHCQQTAFTQSSATART